jgi:hypothetical protein
MTVGTHRGAHEFHLREVDGFRFNKQVSAGLEVGLRIPTLYRRQDRRSKFAGAQTVTHCGVRQ